MEEGGIFAGVGRHPRPTLRRRHARYDAKRQTTLDSASRGRTTTRWRSSLVHEAEVWSRVRDGSPKGRDLPGGSKQDNRRGSVHDSPALRLCRRGRPSSDPHSFGQEKTPPEGRGFHAYWWSYPQTLMRVIELMIPKLIVAEDGAEPLVRLTELTFTSALYDETFVTGLLDVRMVPFLPAP